MLLCLVIKQVCYVMSEKCCFIFRRGNSIAETRGWGEQTKRQAAVVIPPLCGSDRWRRPSWLQLDTSAGLESEIIFIFSSLGFPILLSGCYCPVLHGAVRPLGLVSSKVNKSCLCSLFSVGSSTDGEQLRDLLDTCKAFELSSALGS